MNLKITLRAGHNATPNQGANGILNEDKMTKETAKELSKILTGLGHTVYDVTPYGKIFDTSGKSLNYEVKKVNDIKPDFHVCIHYNASNGAGHGTEVLIGSNASEISKTVANKVLNNICNSIGTSNRGVKVRTNLFVLNHIKCPVILTEGLFCDNEEDVKKYNSTIIAQAIADGILGKESKLEKIDEEFSRKLTLLKIKGYISSPEYWSLNATEGKTCKGSYVKGLIEGLTKESFDTGVKKLVSNEIISSPDYWVNNINGECNGSYVMLLIKNFCRKYNI